MGAPYTIPDMFSTARALAVCLLFSSITFAQSTAPLPDKPQPQPDSGFGKKRILGIIPANDVTTMNAKGRLTVKDKARLFALNSFDFFTLIDAGFNAGINQATDTPHGFGQGGEGYAKRFGSAVAGKVSGDFFTLFAYPALFHQDPRYFRRGTGSKGSRLVYAISRTFVTRTDSGGSAFNISQILGQGSSAALTNAYYPEAERTAGRTFGRMGLNLGTTMGLNIFKEFFPSFWSKMSKNKKENTR